ncbi:glycerophosphocholine phosphodiesterase GPCPD1 isoform X1 [Ictalurus punctatus]|uniref:Glycerophosphocholine phosphodiesterase GPCPD1 isoform X1 n=2 Tax=Ictalurus punctatus TaxID=7998 RepID=A0A2D0Q066_ICTPU|nr:glycerophosphocholine phosphodiesterase GPCPD1 isoform X1 [Ictalurus punctatus]XP_047007037.1 glycerophosphocholine phosphodiesterase GPCPD1 isoform X1 [Ictalurus punctatus]XP_047007038.1 glycerophosphocholine phosphodiesterase GPCPD1 isoform X1 [Ictalurus punctatus]XP_053531579.1 glycerophosphocholine phosphodiesterase GPCPD1 isoform X1 [Ictalurus punctatus]
MECIQVTLTVRGTTSLGEVIAVVGSCETLGSWCYQKALPLQPAEEDSNLWKRTITVSKGVQISYRYFKGFFLESKMSTNSDWVAERVNAVGPCQVIVNNWETHQQPRSLSSSEVDHEIDDGQFGFCMRCCHADGAEYVDSGWLTCQTEIRLRLHHSVKPPVSITKKEFKTSRFRLKLMLAGIEEEDEEESPSSRHKMTTTLEISMISDGGYKSRHTQPECGYALEPAQWTEYSIHTMEPDNLELVFEFFEEDLSKKVVQGDIHPGHVGIACLLSSSFLESGKDNGVVTLPIMSRNSRQTIGKVRVDYLVIRPIQGFICDMNQCYTKYWRKGSALDVGHRGAGSTHAAKHHKIRENTIASFLSAANHGAAYVEFDVHLSKDLVPIVYHDLTCCISTKKKNDKNSMVLFEVPVKDLTFDQLQLLKLAHSTAMKVHDHKDLQDEEEYVDEHQPFPSLSQIFQTVPDSVGFNIELKWIAQMKDGSWDGNLSTYFNMNQFLDVILTCVLQNAGKRRIVFSCFDPDVCAMVRRKQNKYPILFLTQGVSMVYPQLMDIRCQTTQIAMSFAQSENILGISAHTEDLLRNMDCITEAQSKGLVVFCWGDDNNEHENRKLLREKGIDGLIYDRICEAQIEQPNIFKVEEKVSIKEVIPEETLKSCACSTYSISCTAVPCSGEVRGGSGVSDTGLSSS